MLNCKLLKVVPNCNTFSMIGSDNRSIVEFFFDEILAFIHLTHQNYFGIDDNLGPVAVSVIRDKIELQSSKKYLAFSPYMYRIIIRLSDVAASSIWQYSSKNAQRENGTALFKLINQRKDVVKFHRPFTLKRYALRQP
uniref:LAGLIDADG homing endonuclease n=1 Tax=Romanomermis culicivorax TaxID=13658 RepID=A0A915JMN6_ROMCU